MHASEFPAENLQQVPLVEVEHRSDDLHGEGFALDARDGQDVLQLT